MSKQTKQNFITIHQKIKKTLFSMIEENSRACVNVAQLASSLGVDQRTVKSHLKIMEVDEVGIFIDHTEKQFCTKEGITFLANYFNKYNQP